MKCLFRAINTQKTNLVILVSCFLFLAGCKKSTPNLPIAEQNLVPILVDVHKVEAALDAENVFVKDTLGKKYYTQVFEKYHVNKRDFDSTMAILEHDPEHLQKIYKLVVKGLEPN